MSEEPAVFVAGGDPALRDSIALPAPAEGLARFVPELPCGTEGA